MAYPVQEYVALVDSSGNLVGLPGTAPQGRLTNTTLVPVLTAAAASAATVFYTPYVGNFVPIYDGTVMMPTEFTELTNTLASATGGPAAGAVSENYDMFVWSNGGTLTLTRGPVWTNATTRSAGTALVMVKGILLNNASITNGPAASRGTYVGTIRTDAGAVTVSWSRGASGAAGTLHVWNMYNRVPVVAHVQDATASWPYSSSTIRQVRASAVNQVSLVRGLDNDAVDATYSDTVSLAAVAGTFGKVYVGLDSTTAAAAFSVPGFLQNDIALGLSGMITAEFGGLPGLGFHTIAALESADNTNNVTFIGTVSQLLKVLANY